MHPVTAPNPADELVTEHHALVAQTLRGLAARLPSHVDRDELMSAGYDGLLFAARHFDASRGIPFPAYAIRRIKGAMLDSLRASDWVSRTTRANIRRRSAAESQLAVTLGREATRAEVAATLLTSTEAIDTSVRDEQWTHLEALDDSAAVEQETPLDLLLGREERAYLRDAIAALPESLRAVIVGRYLDGCTLRELGAARGVSEARISQLHSDALKLLRAALTYHLHGSAELTCDGVAAQRRQSYYAEVGQRSAWRTRLA